MYPQLRLPKRSVVHTMIAEDEQIAIQSLSSTEQMRVQCIVQRSEAALRFLVVDKEVLDPEGRHVQAQVRVSHELEVMQHVVVCESPRDLLPLHLERRRQYPEDPNTTYYSPFESMAVGVVLRIVLEYSTLLLLFGVLLPPGQN